MILKEKQLRKIIEELLSEYYSRSGGYRFTGTDTASLFGYGSGTGADEINGVIYTPDIPEGTERVFPVPKGIKKGSEPQKNRLDPVSKKVSRPHRGYDFSATTGTPILSVADGKVVKTSNHTGYGKYVIIAHDSALIDNLSYTAYNHLSKSRVSVGQTVSAGQVIGLSGNSGSSTGPHLHFSIGGSPKHNEMSFDKAQYDAFLDSCTKVSVSKDSKGPADDSVSEYERNVLSKKIKAVGSPVEIDGVTYEKFRYKHSGSEKTYLVSKDASKIRVRTDGDSENPKALSADNTAVVDAQGIKNIFRIFLGIKSADSIASNNKSTPVDANLDNISFASNK